MHVGVRQSGIMMSGIDMSVYMGRKKPNMMDVS